MFQFHLESTPRYSAHLLSSCRCLWSGSSRFVINVHDISQYSLVLWPLFNRSTHYHFVGVNLNLNGSAMTDLPHEIALGCTFLHTLHLCKCRGLKSVSRFVDVSVIKGRLYQYQFLIELPYIEEFEYFIPKRKPCANYLEVKHLRGLRP